MDDKSNFYLILIAFYVFGVLLSDYFNRRTIRKLDKKYTYINEIFEQYLLNQRADKSAKELTDFIENVINR